MLNLRDIASLEKARKEREAQRRMGEYQRSQSVMFRRPDAEWLPDYQRPGGHALEAPMFSPDDLIGSGIGKPIMLGAKALAGLSGAGLAAMAKSAGSKSLADVVRGSRQETAGFRPPASPLGDTVKRSNKGLTDMGLEPDIVRSIMSDEQYKEGISRSAIEGAKAARARYRQEPATTPGPAASEEDWARWGQQHGVNMTVTQPQSLGISDVRTKREAVIPGGLEGEFTIPDLFWIKGNNFDPSALPKEVHTDLMKKFMRTYQPPGYKADDVDIFNALNFSILSPNAPLTPNEFLAMRGRISTPEELAALAARKGEKDLGNKMVEEQGVGAAGRGGMGIKGTANMGNAADLAYAMQAKPEMFRPAAGETLNDVNYRVMNQIPGLGQKTASLGTPLTDLWKGNTAAVDLHMIRNNYEKLMADPVLGPRFVEQVSKKFGVPPEPAAIKAKIDAEIADPKGNQSYFKLMREVIETPSESVYRTAKGELGRVPSEIPAIAPEKLLYEPKQGRDYGDFYKGILGEIDKSRGPNPDLELFPEQWRLWDTYRGRVEPHEMLHPDYRKLPKQSFTEMSDAFKAHSGAGYIYADKVGTVPTTKAEDWRKLYYGFADPKLLGGIVIGGGAAGLAGGDYFTQSLVDMERKRLEDEERRRLQMEAQ
jgi:hypothetical protein